ncbi:DoxX family protein [Chelativorans sp. AA-79]|uniref:DoxX family protein n=1 Tax=Chelativorans sp. AA-79 TaxID=3028735 RepID=UPI0023F7B1CE|nr:DoxX family protein [Chelativorans sp. AA-79]WEX11300.1 DoxX family protein [Chelativorans sp. AA-79]
MPGDSLPWVVILARILLGGAFAFAGLRNLTNLPVLTSILAGRGVPLPRVALLAGIAVQIVCGLLVITGVWTVAAAAGLILFLVLATYLFNNFWDHQGIERGNRINGVVSNVALVGAFLLVMAL